MSDALSFRRRTTAIRRSKIRTGRSAPDEDDYNTWNVGGTYAIHGFSLDLRYHDTDIDAGSDIEAYTFGPSSYDSRSCSRWSANSKR